MFSNEKNNGASNKRAAGATTKDGGVTILTAGCHFSGKLYCKGATRIGGTIDGEVIAEGLLIVEEDAVINANVRAEDIVVHGRMEGSLTVQRKIEMCATADVQADISTPNMVVHEGALFNGRTSMKRAVSTNELGKKSGKTLKESHNKHIDLPAIDAGSDKHDGLAARIPDVNFA